MASLKLASLVQYNFLESQSTARPAGVTRLELMMVVWLVPCSGRKGGREGRKVMMTETSDEMLLVNLLTERILGSYQ